MYLLATSFYDGKYNLVDNVWSSSEFYNNEHKSRMRRHSLRMDIIEMVTIGEYDVCIMKTFWLAVFQRRWLRLRSNFLR